MKIEVWNFYSKRFALVVFAIFFLPFSFAAASDNEIPLEAMLGNKMVYLKWKDSFQKWYD
jgi:hypothetical protein